jgi:hypothetical protein
MAISFAQKYLQVKQETISTKQELKRHKRISSLSDDEDEQPLLVEPITESEFVEYVRHIDDRFLRAVSFIAASLKTSPRVAEFPTLGMLASSLEAVVR